MFARLVRALDRALERIGNYGLLVSGILILVMSWLSTYAVFRRYVFRSPEPYSYELGMSFLLACVVLAVAALQRLGKHLRVDFVANRFPGRVQAVLTEIVVPVLGLVYISVMVWQSWNVAWYSFQIHETSQSSWQEPLWPVKMVVPFGSGLLWLVLFAQLIRGIHSLLARPRRQ